MRKLNTILSVLLLFICLLHGLMGSFMLLGISSGAGKFLAWIGVGILAAHTVLGLLLTAQTFRASRSGGKLYGKQNALFWARRTSGLAILLMLFFHIGVFGRVQDGVYILFPFTTVRLPSCMAFSGDPCLLSSMSPLRRMNSTRLRTDILTSPAM